MKPNFAVSVRHDGRPLTGVAVEISTDRNNDNTKAFSAVTATDGIVHVSNLPPGDYWISADLLGINAAYQCFHVSNAPSRQAKRALKYEWGDLAPAMRRVAGRLIDSQPSKGGSPIWNIIHRVEIPITSASLILRNPLTVTAYRSSSNESGGFSFDDVPSGTYVLHIEGGSAGERSYDATDLLLKVSRKASRRSLLL